MTTAITTTSVETIIASIEFKSTGRGRPTNQDTVAIRRAVVRAIIKAEGEISTKDIIRATKKSKAKVIPALVWAQKQGLIKAVASQKQKGRGRPYNVWIAA